MFEVSPLLVGRITHQGIQRPEVTASLPSSPRTATILGPRTVINTYPNSESHSTTTTLDTEVEQPIQRLDDVEPSVPDPKVVRFFSAILHCVLCSIASRPRHVTCILRTVLTRSGPDITSAAQTFIGLLHGPLNPISVIRAPKFSRYVFTP